MMNRVKTLGQGGFGKVELLQSLDGKMFACKRMNFQSRSGTDILKKEIMILQRLKHPNIIPIVNFDLSVPHPWYLMPYYPDGSLRDRLVWLQHQRLVFSLEAATQLVLQLAQALQYARDNGAFHRDLKPENILLDKFNPVIADWGLGKFVYRASQLHTHRGQGTRIYCSPEQWNWGWFDHRSDMFSLGLIYREMVSGATDGRVPNLRMKAVIDRMTRGNYVDRYSSYAELIEDLKHLKNHLLRRSYPAFH